MDVIVFESADRLFLGIIEQALTDNGIPYLVTGAADVGLATVGITILVKVPEQHAEMARDIVLQLTS